MEEGEQPNLEVDLLDLRQVLDALVAPGGEPAENKKDVLQSKLIRIAFTGSRVKGELVMLRREL